MASEYENDCRVTIIDLQTLNYRLCEASQEKQEAFNQVDPKGAAIIKNWFGSTATTSI